MESMVALGETFKRVSRTGGTDNESCCLVFLAPRFLDSVVVEALLDAGRLREVEVFGDDAVDDVVETAAGMNSTGFCCTGAETGCAGSVDADDGAEVAEAGTSWKKASAFSKGGVGRDEAAERLDVYDVGDSLVIPEGGCDCC